ncbi:hypothetical protein ACAX43_28155 [Paraburkholderia sp. IW21]|uniref:hypothetical protein n=1 Tax=Paraburkholderia sp. IW21 TaxID=3242488 RepID=UPI0035228421
MFLAATTVLLATFALAETAYVSVGDADVNIKCTCVADGSYCQSKLFDGMQDKPRVTWYQSVHVRGGKPANLDAACYRKRDVEYLGGGACCVVPGDEKTSIDNLFRGEVQ